MNSISLFQCLKNPVVKLPKPQNTYIFIGENALTVQWPRTFVFTKNALVKNVHIKVCGLFKSLIMPDIPRLCLLYLLKQISLGSHYTLLIHVVDKFHTKQKHKGPLDQNLCWWLWFWLSLVIHSWTQRSQHFNLKGFYPTTFIILCCVVAIDLDKMNKINWIDEPLLWFDCL